VTYCYFVSEIGGADVEAVDAVDQARAGEASAEAAVTNLETEAATAPPPPPPACAAAFFTDVPWSRSAGDFIAQPPGEIRSGMVAWCAPDPSRAQVRAAASAGGATRPHCRSGRCSRRRFVNRGCADCMPETQNLGAARLPVILLGYRGKPRFKPVARGLHSLTAKDGKGALRPKTDVDGRLVGLRWGAGS
jgi:hypothetical protein